MQEQQGQQEPRESAETQVAQEREGVYKIILAPNPSIMTGPGTNTIVVGGAPNGSVIIDPAVDTVEYLDTVVYEGVQRGPIRCILITHGHGDHTGGAVALRERLKVPIYAFGLKGFPEADAQVSDGDTFPVGDDTLIAIHTPGHRFDHLCYMLEKHRILFAGDLVAGVGTVVIIPPEEICSSILTRSHGCRNLISKRLFPRTDRSSQTRRRSWPSILPTGSTASARCSTRWKPCREVQAFPTSCNISMPMSTRACIPLLPAPLRPTS